MINRTSGMPLYIQLADKIRQEIREGKINPGDKLMSESEMVKYYQIGRLTIREALSVLVNEGLLIKHHGKGTFCAAVPSDEARLKFDLLLDTTDVYFIPYYLKSICATFESRQCDIVINDTKNDAETINRLLSDICEKGSDGVIIQPCSYTQISAAEETERLFAKLIRREIPYIMIDGIYENAVPSYAVLDEIKAGALAAQCFRENGHKNVCMIHYNKYKDSVLRMKGFAEESEKEPYLIDFGGHFKEQIGGMLGIHPEITAIFCYNDLVAKQCIEFLNTVGVSVPDDISVISVDDTVIASAVSPPLTSIVHPKEKMGAAVAAAMLDIKDKKTEWPYKRVFEPEIIMRRSVKRI